MPKEEVLIVVEKPVVSEKVSKPIEEDLFWYDTFYKKMRKFKGTALEFEYVAEEYVEDGHGKRTPKAEATKEQIEMFGLRKKYVIVAKSRTDKKVTRHNKIDQDAIKEWFKDYDRKNHSSATIEHEDHERVTFRVDKSELRDFKDDLYRNRLEYVE